MKYIEFKHLDEVFNIEPSGGGDWIPTGPHTSSQEGELNPFYGLKHTEESKKLMRDAAKNRNENWKKRQSCANAKKTYLFISPEGAAVRIRGSLKQFCESRGLNNGAMSNLHRGQGQGGSLQHKGWRAY